MSRAARYDCGTERGAMSQSGKLNTVLNMRPKLEEQIVTMRDEGQSYETIARWVSNKTKVVIGREVVRRWFVERDNA